MASNSTVARTIQQLNQDAEPCLQSDPQRAILLFKAAISANEEFNLVSGKHDFHVLTSLIRLGGLLYAQGSEDEAKKMFKRAVGIAYSFPSSVRQAFLPAVHSESAMSSLRSQDPEFDAVLETVNDNIAQNQHLTQQSKASRRRLLADLSQLREIQAPPVVPDLTPEEDVQEPKLGNGEPAAASGVSGSASQDSTQFQAHSSVDQSHLHDDNSASSQATDTMSDSSVPSVGRQPSSPSPRNLDTIVKTEKSSAAHSHPIRSEQQQSSENSQSVDPPPSTSTTPPQPSKRKLHPENAPATSSQQPNRSANGVVKVAQKPTPKRARFISSASTASASGDAKPSVGGAARGPKKSLRFKNTLSSKGATPDVSPAKQATAKPSSSAVVNDAVQKRGLKLTLGGLKMRLGTKKSSQKQVANTNVAGARDAGDGQPKDASEVVSTVERSASVDTNDDHESASKTKPAHVSTPESGAIGVPVQPTSVHTIPTDAAAAARSVEHAQQSTATSAAASLTGPSVAAHETPSERSEEDKDNSTPSAPSDAKPATEVDTVESHVPQPVNPNASAAAVSSEDRVPEKAVVADPSSVSALTPAPAHTSAPAQAPAPAPTPTPTPAPNQTSVAASVGSADAHLDRKPTPQPSTGAQTLVDADMHAPSPGAARSDAEQPRCIVVKPQQKPFNPASLIAERSLRIAAGAAALKAKLQKEQKHRYSHLMKELAACRAKLLSQQNSLITNTHVGQRKRLRALERQNQRGTRNVKREGDWRDSAVRDAHRTLIEGRDIAHNSHRHKQKNVVRKVILQRLAVLQQKQMELRREAQERAREKQLADEAAGNIEEVEKIERAPAAIRRSSRSRNRPSKPDSKSKDDSKSSKRPSRSSRTRGGRKSKSGRKRGSDSGSGSDSDSDDTGSTRSSNGGTSSSGSAKSNGRSSSSSKDKSEKSAGQSLHYEAKLRQHEQLRKRVKAVRQHLGMLVFTRVPWLFPSRGTHGHCHCFIQVAISRVY